MRYIDEYVLGAIQAVVGPDTDRDLFSDRSRAARERLREVLDQARKNNQQARDLRRLVKLATETQDAANPRPMTVLLSNLTHTVMAEGGNPAYKRVLRFAWCCTSSCICSIIPACRRTTGTLGYGSAICGRAKNCSTFRSRFPIGESARHYERSVQLLAGESSRGSRRTPSMSSGISRKLAWAAGSARPPTSTIPASATADR